MNKPVLNSSAAPPETLASYSEALASSAKFKALLRAKKRFIVPATLFFLAYYFALPLLTGYAPELMSRKVFGSLSLAYVFALSQFPMAWIIAWRYLRAAAHFDRTAKEILAGNGETKA